MGGRSTFTSPACGRAFEPVAEEVLGQLDPVLVRRSGTRDHEALARALKGVIDL